MKLTSAAALLAVGLAVPVLGAGPVAARAGVDLGAVESFALALGVDLDDPATAAALARYDLVVIDGIDADAGLVAELQEAGTIVLGYLSVGTIEDGRPWTAEASAHRLDYWADWEEWYADVADAGFRALVLEDAAPAVLAAGFDGLFLDNLDMVETHPDQLDGMGQLVAALDELLGDRLLFAQNGDDVIDGFADHLDGWNREDLTSAGNPQGEGYAEVDEESRASGLATLVRLAARGLLVTTTDYVEAGDDATTDEAVERACSVGALPFVSDIELTRLGEPITC